MDIRLNSIASKEMMRSIWPIISWIEELAQEDQRHERDVDAAHEVTHAQTGGVEHLHEAQQPVGDGEDGGDTDQDIGGGAGLVGEDLDEATHGYERQ